MAVCHTNEIGVASLYLCCIDYLNYRRMISLKSTLVPVSLYDVGAPTSRVACSLYTRLGPTSRKGCVCGSMIGRGSSEQMSTMVRW